MARNAFAFVLIIVATVFSGCTMMSYEHLGADGSRTAAKTMGWATSPVYDSSGYDGVDYRYRYRGDTRDVACTGPFGQTINGVCYHTKPYWMR